MPDSNPPPLPLHPDDDDDDDLSDAESEQDDELQYDGVEPTAAAPAGSVLAAGIARAAPTCAVCGRAITSTYFSVRDKVLCPACRETMVARPPGSRTGRLMKATIYGLGAGLAGAAIWYAVRKATGYEIGYIALLVGFLVGKGVLAGSKGRGGRRYQVLALLLTYACIAANYMPDAAVAMINYSRKVSTTQPASSSAGHVAASRPATQSANPPTFTPGPRAHSPAAGGKLAQTLTSLPRPIRLVAAVAVLAVIVFFVAAVAPVLAGFHNLIGMLLIVLALFQAWKMTAGRKFAIAGPFTLAR